MADKKEKRYVSDNAQLMAEWDWEKNNNIGIHPNAITLGSERKTWWKCSKGHSWQANIYNRYKNSSGCPYCSHLMAIPGENDFTTKHPDIAKEWHPIKNKNINPREILPSSDKKVWWICEQGHEWQTSVYNRCKIHTNCPYCSGRKAISGLNDLQTIYPDLVIEWDFEKNAPLLPNQITSKSNKKVWWKCKQCGHEWQTSPNSRVATTHFTGCPKCTKEAHTSFPEQAIYYFVSKFYPEAVNGFVDDFLGQMELDIYIPSLKIAIEYDGIVWHTSDTVKRREKTKYSACQQNGIYLIRIREEASNNSSNDCDLIIDICKNATSQDISKALASLSQIIPMEGPFNVALEEPQIRSNYLIRAKANSLQSLYPEVARYWNYTKNQGITPDSVTPKSGYNAWWKCDKGHEWCALVSNMVQNHARHQNQSTSGCPYCDGKKIIPGETDFKTLSPELASQWNYGKNADLLPEDFAAHSNKKVWWRCELGHEWETTINSRYSGGHGCPYCAGRKILSGYNDLATCHPHLMPEWNFSKNAHIDPTKIGAKSKEKVWWKCVSCGHEWLTSVAVRTRGSKCPQCAKENRKKRK